MPHLPDADVQLCGPDGAREKEHSTPVKGSTPSFSGDGIHFPVKTSPCHSKEGEDSPPSPDSQRSSAFRVEGKQSELESSGDSLDKVDTSSSTCKEVCKPMAETGRKTPSRALVWMFDNMGPAIPRSPFGDSPTSSTDSSCSTADLYKDYQDADSLPPPRLLVLEEDGRTTDFLRALPKDILVVDRGDLIPVAESWSSLSNHVGAVQYQDKLFVLKEFALTTEARQVYSEHHLYRNMSCEDPILRELALEAFEHSFAILDEARFLLHCRSLQGVVRLEGVCIVKEPCRRVTGLLLEQFPRGDLQDVLESEPNLPYQRKIAMALEVARIVEGLHRIGIVHADLKPANILVADDGSLRLCDFGNAFFLSQPPSSSEPRGTPSYMAPEVYAKGVFSVESDIFALGVIMFEIMEQRVRLRHEDDEDIECNYKNGNVFYTEGPGDGWPEEWRDLVVSCMAVLPEDRPPLSQIIARLSAWLDREGRAR